MLRSLLVATSIACSFFVFGCKQDAKIVEGGVYAFPSADGSYTISKVLVADESAVHIRSYKESFKTLPTTVDTSKLAVFIGHAPLDPAGFLKDKPKLISVEKVHESELEGYRYYLDAVGAGH